MSLLGEPHGVAGSSDDSGAQGSIGTNTVMLVVASGGPVLAAIFGTWVPWQLAVLVSALGLVVASPRVVFVGLLLLVGARSGAAIDTLVPVSTAPVQSVEIDVVGDPQDGSFGQWVLVRMGSDHLVATTSSVGASIATVSAGDRLVVTGSVRPRSPASGWEISNRLVGSLNVSEVISHTPAGGLRGYANQFRDVLAKGARSLERDHQALLAGLTVGDDRAQSTVTAANFRAGGLGHLLAVSGQNVVFVLLAVAPVLSRIRSPAMRVVVTLLVLVFFGFVTRFEPSVTRALAMVSLAVVATSLGRRGDAIRTLPAAVAVLLLWDPLLAFALAFQLSVAATLGLLLISPWVQERLRGPQSLRAVLAATIGAQLAVAPLILAFFRDVSLVAVPANVAAVPVSGAAMMWGMTGGFVAGLSPSPVAWAIHRPTAVMLWWIDGVATVAASAPVAALETRGAILVLVGLVFIGASRSLRFRAGSVVGVIIVALALLVPIVSPRSLPAGHHVLVDGLSVHRQPTGADLVVVSGTVDPQDGLRALRRARLGRIDLVVSVDGSRLGGVMVRSITQTHEVLDVWAPPGHQVPGARTVVGLRGSVGAQSIRVALDGTVLFMGGSQAR